MHNEWFKSGSVFCMVSPAFPFHIFEIATNEIATNQARF